MAAQPIVISSDEHAWRILEQWLDKSLTDDQEAEFVNWPILGITVRGEDYLSSLNDGQMSALVELKRTVGRAYASIAHGAYDMRHLKSEEQEQLEFSTTVREGSSITDTDLTPLIQAIASAVTMYPAAAIAAGAVIGLLFVARPVILKHYETRAKELDVEERGRLLDLGLNRDEEQQYRTFERAVLKLDKIFPHFARALPDAAGGFWRFASASANATDMTIAGIDLSQNDLELLSERRKRRPRDVTEVEQRFQVLGVARNQGAFRIQLHSANLQLTVQYRQPQMTPARVKRLFSFMSTTTPILAKVEIRTAEGAPISGRLLRFKPLEDSNDGDA